MSISVALALQQLGPAAGHFNFTQCPDASEVQAPRVGANFSLASFAGTYYELAYHDYTQFPLCPDPSCVRTTKSVDAAAQQVLGNWSIVCVGKRYPVELVFNLTATKGVFAEFNKEHFNVPNMVVDYDHGPGPTQQYHWVIEFQCAENAGHVDFIGINFYSQLAHVSPETFAAMEAAARARGLGPYMDSGFRLRNMSQTGCPP